MAMASHTGLVSVKNAKVALANFQQQRFQVDPDNTDHQQAYMILRDQTSRVSGKMLMGYLNTKKEVVSSGQRAVVKYWAMPRANFPRGLPPSIAPSEVTGDDARACKYDPVREYLIEQNIPQTALGLGVYTVEKFQGSMATGVTSGNQMPGLPSPSALQLTDDSGAGSSSDVRATGGGGGATGGGGGGATYGGGATGGGRGLKRDRSIGDDGEPPSPESAAMKKTRTEQQALMLLKSMTRDAKRAERWVHPPTSMAPRSVLHYMGKTIEALEELTKANNSDAKVRQVNFQYTGYAVRLLMNHRAYPDIIRFKGFLNRLVSICGDAIDDNTKDECKLLEQIAAIDEDNDKPLERISNVFVETTFKECECFKSFVHCKAQFAIDAAFRLAINKDRVAILEPMRDMAGIPPQLLDKIDMTILLCNANGAFTNEDLAEYIVSNLPQAAKLAASWHPDTVVGAIGCLTQKTLPDFCDVTYPIFALAASAIQKGGLVEELESPLAKEAIAFVEAGNGLPPAFAPVMEAALQARIGTPIRTVFVHPLGLSDEDDAAALFKLVKGFLPKASQPDWYAEWKVVMENKEKEKEKAAADNKLVVRALKARVAEAKKQAIATSGGGATGGGRGYGM